MDRIEFLISTGLAAMADRERLLDAVQASELGFGRARDIELAVQAARRSAVPMPVRRDERVLIPAA